jgi:hypothetical protein
MPKSTELSAVTVMKNKISRQNFLSEKTALFLDKYKSNQHPGFP